MGLHVICRSMVKVAKLVPACTPRLVHRSAKKYLAWPAYGHSIHFEVSWRDTNVGRWKGDKMHVSLPDVRLASLNA